jgi:hypothetical protein
MEADDDSDTEADPVRDTLAVPEGVSVKEADEDLLAPLDSDGDRVTDGDVVGDSERDGV